MIIILDSVHRHSFPKHDILQTGTVFVIDIKCKVPIKRILWTQLVLISPLLPDDGNIHLPKSCVFGKRCGQYKNNHNILLSTYLIFPYLITPNLLEEDLM